VQFWKCRTRGLVFRTRSGGGRSIGFIVVLPARTLAEDAGELGAEAVVGLAVPDLADRLPVDVPQLLALEDAAGGHGAGGADHHRVPADQAVAVQPLARPGGAPAEVICRSPARPRHFRHELGTDAPQVSVHAVRMDERAGATPEEPETKPTVSGPSLGGAPTWIALPVGRAETGPTIAELVEAVRAAGGMVGGDALFDPRYEPEMRRFLIRALEMEGIPVPKGGDTP